MGLKEGRKQGSVRGFYLVYFGINDGFVNKWSGKHGKIWMNLYEAFEW